MKKQVQDTKLMKLGVIIPVYNEEKTLAMTVERLLGLKPGLQQIIISDDGSTDKSRAVAEELIRRHSGPETRLQLVSSAENRGKTAAIVQAMAALKAPYVLIQDADLEYNPADIPALYAALEPGSCVFGSRFLNDSAAQFEFTGRLANRVISFLGSLLLGRRLSDLETGYKLFSAELVKDYIFTSSRFAFEVEVTFLLAKSGQTIKEIPIHYRRRGRAEGKKISWLDGLEAIYRLFYYALTMRPRNRKKG